jgi:ketosteroid isomerase-like protein
VELEWSGILAVAVMGLAAGSEMKAFVAMFLTFRDGKIGRRGITTVIRHLPRNRRRRVAREFGEAVG